MSRVVDDYRVGADAQAGNVSANALLPAKLTNDALTRGSYPHWGATRYYLVPNSDPTGLKWVGKTIATYRDGEVSGWGRIITLVARYSGGKALVLALSGEGNNASIRLTSNVDTGTFDTFGSGVTLWSTADLSATFSGYNGASTGDDEWTLGCDGLEIYVKFNNVKCVSITSHLHMVAGNWGAKSLGDAGYGLRFIGFRQFTTKALLSDFTAQTYDIRDFGAKQTRAIGNMTAGSNLLRLTKKSAFLVGERVIVELGGEQGRGQPGAKGVGGVWPALSYANATARAADNSQASNTYAWERSTGNVYKFTTPSTWTQETSGLTAKAYPKALRATITAISADGLTLTLSTSAAVGAKNANVYYDCAWAFMKLVNNPGEYWFSGAYEPTAAYVNASAFMPSNFKVVVPEGKWAIGERITPRAITGIEVVGAGIGKSEVFSPRGVESACMLFITCPNSSVHDLTWRGNGDAEWGHTPNFGSVWESGRTCITQTSVPQGNDAWSPGILFGQGSHNSAAYNLDVYDTWQQAVAASFADNLVMHDIALTLSYGSRDYIGWQIQFADATGGSATDITITSPKQTGGFESFKGTNQTWTRCVGINALWAFNNSQGWVMNYCEYIKTPLSNSWGSLDSPSVDVNSNIGLGNTDAGGTINNIRIDIQGYGNSGTKKVQSGIVINDNDPNITINGGYYSAPPWVVSGYGPRGVVSTGASTIVDGFTSLGRNEGGSIYQANIGVGTSGEVRNCTADIIVVGGTATTSNNVKASA